MEAAAVVADETSEPQELKDDKVTGMFVRVTGRAKPVSCLRRRHCHMAPAEQLSHVAFGVCEGQDLPMRSHVAPVHNATAFSRQQLFCAIQSIHLKDDDDAGAAPRSFLCRAQREIDALHAVLRPAIAIGKLQWQAQKGFVE
jgi:hypothetical protein